jgi:DNA-binding PadR family transcriptional regulator
MATTSLADVTFGTANTYMRSCVLALLAEGRKHGYELLGELSEGGYGEADQGGLYRSLRAMEEQGLVVSDWERGRVGPARRAYAITPEGLEALHRSVELLREMRRRLDRALRFYRRMTAQPSATAADDAGELPAG